ncbi:MAG: TIR domain-containing protein [Xanthobacteraceae bacterium]
MAAAERTVYLTIQKTAAANRVSRDLGALLLAGEQGISYERFATPEQMAALRGAPAHVVAVEAPARRQSASAKNRKKPIVTIQNNSIFVVHGRDTQVNADIFAFLRAIGLNPLEWSQAIKAAKGNNPHIDDVIYNAMERVQGVLVMFSPDEEARLKTKLATAQDKKRGINKLDSQARPNVIFEAGLALGAHSQKTLLVQVGDTREISDIAGKHLVHLSNSPASRKELAQRLQSKLKFKVDTTGTDWLSIGNFDR